MNAKQTEEAKRALRMQVFAEDRVADFTHTPAVPVDTKHAATLTKLAGVIEALGGKQAIQEAGEFGEETEEQRGDRGTVEAMLRKINKTVAAIAEETKRPALMDRFRLPHGDGDTELAAKLRSFGTALEAEGLLPALAEHSLVVTRAGLEQMATDLLHGTGEQGTARAKQAGATASIPETLKEARSCKKTFDAIYGNFYEDNTEVLAAWHSASLVPPSQQVASEISPHDPQTFSAETTACTSGARGLSAPVGIRPRRYVWRGISGSSPSTRGRQPRTLG